MTTQSLAQRQAAYRARKAAAELREVRGIFLPQALHAALKEHARKLLKLDRRGHGCAQDAGDE